MKRINRETYSHRGDRIRRNDRIRKGLLVVALIGAVALIPKEQPREVQAATGGFNFGLTAESRRLRADLDATKSELEAARAQLERANAIMSYSAAYKVGTDVAAPIYDVALRRGDRPGPGLPPGEGGEPVRRARGEPGGRGGSDADHAGDGPLLRDRHVAREPRWSRARTCASASATCGR